MNQLFIVSNLSQTMFLANSILEPSKKVWANNKETAIKLTLKEVYHLDILDKIKCAVIEA